MIRRLVLAAAVLLTVPATADAYWDLDHAGQPKILMSWLPSSDVELVECPPGGAPCSPLAWKWQGGRPGETPVGTTFEVRGGGQVERSRAWQGRVTSTQPPRISGTAMIGQHVRPVAGTWTGGWGDDASSLWLVACKTRRGSKCVSLPPASTCPFPCVATPEQGKSPSSGGGPAALPPVLAGRYLIAVDTRLPNDRRGWPIGASAPWMLNYETSARQYRYKPETLSAPVKIAAAPKPVVRLRERTLRGERRLNVGRITCTYACKVTIRASGGGERGSTTIFTATGTRALAVPFRRGRLSVRVHVDGKLLANATVRAR